MSKSSKPPPIRNIKLSDYLPKVEGNPITLRTIYDSVFNARKQPTIVYPPKLFAVFGVLISIVPCYLWYVVYKWALVSGDGFLVRDFDLLLLLLRFNQTCFVFFS